MRPCERDHGGTAVLGAAPRRWHPLDVIHHLASSSHLSTEKQPSEYRTVARPVASATDKITLRADCSSAGTPAAAPDDQAGDGGVVVEGVRRSSASIVHVCVCVINRAPSATPPGYASAVPRARSALLRDGVLLHQLIAVSPAMS